MYPKINGTWFEFLHPSAVEGTYWNNTLRCFSSEQWQQKVFEIADLGMEYLVLMSTALCHGDHAECYFSGGPFPFPSDMKCTNPIEVLLSAADQRELKVFISCGFYGDWTHARQNMVDEAVKDRAFSAMETLYRQFSHHPSFYGWYLPDELGIDENGFPDFFIDYVGAYRSFARQLDPSKPMLIAPYGIAKLRVTQDFIDQLRRLDCEMIAYQDGIGVLHTPLEQSANCFAALSQAHQAAGGPKLWADVELFRFEGQVYRSPLLPAPIQRIRQQLEAVADHVEIILSYQYMGLMNPPDSPAHAGSPDSVELYQHYIENLPADF